MASEIRVNQIQNRSGLSTVTFTDTGAIVAGIVTANSFSGDGSNLSGIDASALKDGSNVKVQATSTGAVVTGILTASSGAYTGNITMDSDDPTITMTDTSGTNDTATIESLAGALRFTVRDGNADGEVIFRKFDGTTHDETLRITNAGRVGINTNEPKSDLHIEGTGAIKMPKGTTAQRPSSDEVGMIRYNTNTDAPEYYDELGDTWKNFWQSNSSMRFIIIGGGGGGGGAQSGHGAGGGGAGEMIEQDEFEIPSAAMPMTVGAGGASPAGGPNWGQGSNGSDTVFGTFTAKGGGGGGGGGPSQAANAGRSGGSGGGGGEPASQGTGAAAGAGSGFKFGGGNGGSNSGGGGGGAGGAGVTGDGSTSNTPASDGGVGRVNDITGSNVTYAGGGGGGTNSSAVRGDGGAGGGGNGGNGGTAGSNGTANTGGGGGGAGNAPPSVSGGTGGSGVIIFRVATAKTVTFSGTHTKTTAVVGNDTVYTITAASGATVTFG